MKYVLCVGVIKNGQLIIKDNKSAKKKSCNS